MDYPKILGVHEGNNIYVHNGTYGEYLKHNNERYCIPRWAQKENLKFNNLSHAVNIIDFKNMDRQRKKYEEESIARERIDLLSDNMDRQKRLESRQETSKNYYRNSYFLKKIL